MKEFAFIFILGLSKLASSEYNKIRWVPADKFIEADQHEWAGSIGTSPFFIARVDHKDGLIVGKYDPVNKISVLVDTKPTKFNDNGYVLTYPPGAVTWTYRTTSDATIPTNLLLGGFDPQDLEPMYVCRAVVGNLNEKKIIPGVFKFSAQHKGCIVDFNGKAVYNVDNYELLSMNFLAIALEAA